MPEPASHRTLAVTAAPYEQPFESPSIPLGILGLNLVLDITALKPGEFQILTNAYHRSDGILTSRPGLTSLATAGTNAHSVARLNDPLNSTYTRIWGVD